MIAGPSCVAASEITAGEDRVTTELPDLLRRQIDYIHAGDLDGLMTQYADDATLVRADLQAVGRDAVRDVMTPYLARGPRVASVESVAESADTIVYVATLDVGGALSTAVGTFVLREGLIWRQTAALVPRP